MALLRHSKNLLFYGRLHTKNCINIVQSVKFLHTSFVCKKRKTLTFSLKPNWHAPCKL